MESQEIYEIVLENNLIEEALYCLYMKYEISDEIIEHCVGLCISSENYELCEEFKNLYEKIHGVDSFKKLKV